MFNFFKKKCSFCKTELEKGKDYPEGGFDKKFCSEECKGKYRQELAKGKSKGGCC